MTTATKKYYSEFRHFDLQHFTEEEVEGKKVSTFSGVHQVADMENSNGRVYPLKLFENLMGSDDFASKLKHRQLVGMLGHPADGIVPPQEISHVTTEMKILSDQKLEGGGTPIWCKSEILDTAAGDTLKRLFRAGIRLGTSSRGWGDSHQEGQTEILDENFDLGGFDMVVEPSVDAAFPVANLTEHYDRFARQVQERLDRYEEQEDTPVTGRELEAYQTILDSVCESSPCKIDDDRVQESLKSLRARVQSTIEAGAYDGKKDKDKDAKKKSKKKDELQHVAGDHNMERPAAESSAIERIESTLNATVGELEEENGKLRRDLAYSRESSTGMVAKLESAMKMIERMTARLRGETKHSDAAKRLAEAALDKAKEARRQVTIERKRVDAAAKVVESSLKKAAESHENNLGEHIASLIQRFPAPKREAAAKALKKAKNFSEANSLYRTLVTFGGKPKTEQRDAQVLAAIKGKARAQPVMESVEHRGSEESGNEIVDRTRKLVEHFEQRG